MKTACSCRRCKNCCWRSPGWFGSIRELKGAAKIMGMTVKEFAKEYLIREWWAGDDEDICVPAPRKNFYRVTRKRQAIEDIERKSLGISLWNEEKLRNSKGFVRASWGHNLMAGYACVFLTKDEKCAIHKSKPTECKESFACKKMIERKISPRREAVKYWKKHQDFIRSLL